MGVSAGTRHNALTSDTRYKWPTNKTRLKKLTGDKAHELYMHGNGTRRNYKDTNESETEQFLKHFGYWVPKRTPDQQLTTGEISLQSWAEAAGLRSPCATIGHFPHPHFVNRTIRGLVANCSISRDTPTLHIPTQIVITSHRLKHSPVYDRITTYLELDKKLKYDLEHIMLTLFILFERQDPASYWAPYVSLLPTQLYVPMESNVYGREWFDASDTINRTKRRETVIEYQFEHLSEFFASHPQLLPRGRHFNKAFFSAAYNLVTARSFRLDFGVHRDTLCLVPFADLMNHRPMTQVGWRFQGKAGVNFYPGYEIQHGHQIYNSYGKLGNEDLLHDYGFVSHDNPYTCAHVWFRTLLVPAPTAADEAAKALASAADEAAVDGGNDPDAEPDPLTVVLPSPSPDLEPGLLDDTADQFWDKRAAILAANDVLMDEPFCVRLGPPRPLMAFAAFVLTVPGDMLEDQMQVDNFTALVTVDTIQPAMDVMRRLVQSRLADYAYPISLDERLLPLLKASANNGAPEAAAGAMRQYGAVFIRHQEKLILGSTLEFLEAVSGYHCSLPPTFTSANDVVPLMRVRKACHRYTGRVLVSLMLDMAWNSTRKYVPHEERTAPQETWDFNQETGMALPDW